MKKEYLKPRIKASSLQYELSLLAGTRAASGGVVTPGDGGKTVSPEINETSEDNPGYGHGQGDPSDPVGGGNRSKAYQVWEN